VKIIPAIRWILKTILVLLLLLILMMAAALSVETVSPLEMPRYTITNGDKTVVFQTMTHIANANFYREVQGAILQSKEDGYTYFYESVSIDPKNIANIPESELRAKKEKSHLTEVYQSLADVMGLQVQNQEDFLNLINDKDINVDATMQQLLERVDQVAHKYDKNYHPVKVKLTAEEMDKRLMGSIFGGADIDKLDKGLAEMNKLPKDQKDILGFILRDIISLSSRMTTETMDMLPSNVTEVILDYRNNILSDAIIHGPNKIFITYGQAHLKGVMQRLQKDDPRWHIESSVGVVALKSPTIKNI
jgi:hypothetical protein